MVATVWDVDENVSEAPELSGAYGDGRITVLMVVLAGPAATDEAEDLNAGAELTE